MYKVHVKNVDVREVTLKLSVEKMAVGSLGDSKYLKIAHLAMFHAKSESTDAMYANFTGTTRYLTLFRIFS